MAATRRVLSRNFVSTQGLTSPSECRSGYCGPRLPQRLESRPECCRKRLCLRVALVTRDQHAHSPHPVRLLRVQIERPSHRRASGKSDELSPPHSITSSARPSKLRGNARPSALAVLRLMTSSIFVTCCTGRSAGLSPLRTRPV